MRYSQLYLKCFPTLFSHYYNKNVLQNTITLLMMNSHAVVTRMENIIIEYFKTEIKGFISQILDSFFG